MFEFAKRVGCPSSTGPEQIFTECAYFSSAGWRALTTPNGQFPRLLAPFSSVGSNAKRLLWGRRKKQFQAWGILQTRITMTSSNPVVMSLSCSPSPGVNEHEYLYPRRRDSLVHSLPQWAAPDFCEIALSPGA